MIVSKVKLEFSGATRVPAGKPDNDLRQVFKQAAQKVDSVLKHTTEVEHMSLGQLLYFALLGQGAQV